MKKFLTVLVLLMTAALLLSSCAKQEEPQRFQVVTQQQAAATPIPDSVALSEEGINPENPFAPVEDVNDDFNFDDGSYDPGSEEGLGQGDLINLPFDDPAEATPLVVVSASTPAPTMNSAFAGATPVVIDPIDKPTPTPVPPLSFNFQTYEATKLHLAFEGPAGWTVEDVEGDTYTITNPDAGMSYQAFMTVKAVPVTSNYTKSELTSEVKRMLNNINSSGYSNWSPSKTAERTLLDKNGVYANYTATAPNGAKVAGRVHVTCINKTLYSIHISYPADYSDTYISKVYNQFRKTITITH